MSEADLDSACELAARHGFTVIDRYFGERMASSWYLHVAGDPVLRVAWDGRDENFSILERSGDTPDGFAQWRVLWVGRKGGRESLDFILSKVQDFSRRRS